jgi:hypothetical protein
MTTELRIRIDNPAGIPAEWIVTPENAVVLCRAYRSYGINPDDLRAAIEDMRETHPNIADKCRVLLRDYGVSTQSAPKSFIASLRPIIPLVGMTLVLMIIVGVTGYFVSAELLAEPVKKHPEACFMSAETGCSGKHLIPSPNIP